MQLLPLISKLETSFLGIISIISSPAIIAIAAVVVFLLGILIFF